MARKQLGMVDDALLARVDARAVELGQTRRMFTERALESALAGSGAPAEVAPVSARPPSAAPTRTTAARRAKVTTVFRESDGRCPDCGKANGVHKGDCPQHPRGRHA